MSTARAVRYMECAEEALAASRARGVDAAQRRDHLHAARTLAVLAQAAAVVDEPIDRAEDEPGPLTYSVGDAAALLGISGGTYRQGLARGELPGMRIGRRIVVPRVALSKLLGDDPVR